MSSGPFFMLAGSVCGALLGAPRELALAIGLAGIAVLAGRSGSSGIGVAFLCCAIVSISARPADETVMAEVLATGVPMCDFDARIAERAGGFGTLMRLDSLACEGQPASGVLGVVAVDGDAGEPGARAHGLGRLVPLGDGGFDAGRRRVGAHAELVVSELDVTHPRQPLLAAAAALRRGVRQAGSTLEPRRGALLAGLTIGDTSGIDPATEENMRRAGLAHLVAVSGSNVAIVVGAALVATRRIGRYVSVLIAGATLLLYVLTVGPEPSVLRASAMGAIGLTALTLGRRVQPLAMLCVALSIVLAARPEMIGSVGLHLSAAATTGLILWAGPIAARLSRLPRPVSLACGATIAANIAVAPVLLGVFGELSLTSPLANVLAAAAVAPATVIGLLAGVVGVVGSVQAGSLASIAEPFVAWILAIGDLLGTPASSIQVPRWTGVITGLPVAGVALATVVVRRNAMPPGSGEARLGSSGWR